MTRPASTTAMPSAPISASRHDWPGGRSSDLRRRRGQQAAEGRYQSGRSDHTGKISRAGDSFRRSLLVEAAPCVESGLAFPSNQAPALKAWFEALAARIGRKKALVAMARKLAAIMHAQVVHGLIHGRDFDESVQAAVVAA